MNAEEQYSVNRGNVEYPAWEDAHWVRAGDLPSFHLMRLDGCKAVVLKHSSAIRSVKPDTAVLESEMAKLMEHRDLTSDAKKLLEAALKAQSTGKRPALDFWI